ncbi:citron rho-interacting kinase [Ischnura elegans]|uniref:citron rho-interacting kinase n=1 Tax=Ischnura elegans TaxID=197161 RepID=UPI001ED876E8|nr:citron rho-interacting kinase [Ischnura elegans]XP_046386937.1 citron rho-interacting kinase [Ischnura elegans]
MEPSKEPISVRIARLNNLFLSKTTSNTAIVNKHWVSREGLLDALIVLYDECNNDALKRDKHIANFVDKFRSVVTELRRLRVNITDFEVKKVIGRGHFGEVHVVREKQTGDVYAMKKLRKSDTLSQQSVAFYEEERDIMACAASPWLTSLQYAFQDLNHLYLVMEFHPGGDLLALLERFDGHLSEDMSKFYLAELTLSIHSLHAMKYVHRDIKPDNILIDRCGHLKLADFGSAAKLNDAGIVVSEMPVGTPEYIAPEVLAAMESIAKGKNKKGSYGVECDYWSLGVVAYEMIFGHTPFSGDRLMSTYCNIMNYKETLVFPEDSQVSDSFRNLILGLLKSADERFGHEILVQHKFFSSVDWNGIRETVPPFVPVVNGQDDTSNFVEFDHEAPTPSIANFKVKREFSGQNLPFIGFTYAPEVKSSSSDLVDSPTTKSESNEQLLAAKQKVIQELQVKLQMSEKGDRNKEFEAMEKKLEEKDQIVSKMEDERNRLENDLSKYVSETMALKRFLELERKERLEMEAKAVELVSDAKKKWKRLEKEKVSELVNKIKDKDLALSEANSKVNELTQMVVKKSKEIEAMGVELKNIKKTVNNYKTKMAKADESRRTSVAGVEIRLEQLSQDGKKQIEALQASLEDERKKQAELEKKLHDAEDAVEELQSARAEDSKHHKLEVERLNSGLKKMEAELKEANLAHKKQKEENKSQDRQIQTLEEALRKEKKICRELQDELTRAGECLMVDERDSLTLQTSQLESLLFEKSITVSQLEVELKEAESEKLTLKYKMKEVEDREKEYKDKVSTLETMFSRLEGMVSALTDENSRLKESDKSGVEGGNADEQKVVLQHENNLLEAQLKKLETQLDKLKEQSVLDKQATKTAQTDLWKKEKELSDTKLDLRITTRELKTAEEKLKALQDEKKKIVDNLTLEKKEQMEKFKLKCEQISSLEKELSEMKDKLMSVQEELSSFKESTADEKKALEAKIQSLTLSADNVTAVSRSLEESQRLCKELEAQVKKFEKKDREQNEKVFGVESSLKSSQTELDGAKRRIEALELNSNLLRQACVEMEEQLEDYQKLVSAHETKELLFEEEKKKLVSQLEKETEASTQWKKSHEKEVIKREELEDQLRELTEDAREREGEVGEEIQSLKTKCAEYKCLAEQLTEQVNELEEHLNEVNMELKSASRREEMLRSEANHLKEESTNYLTQIHSLRESNFKLTNDLEEAFSNCQALRKRVDECGSDMGELRALYKQREVKMEATIQQQTKLIDYLQSMAQGKKKKTLSDRLFGSSSNSSTGMPGPSPQVRLRELEAKLSMEKAKNKRLMDDFMRAKTELASLHETMSQGSDQVISQLVQSPCAPQTPSRKPSLQRMHHKIPHRFEMKMNMRPAKCAACLDSVHFGRYAAICEECSMIAHPKCSLLLPNTCGLPTQFVRHFSETWKNGLQNGEDSKKGMNQSGPYPKMESWVKLLKRGKACWEKKYLRLEDQGKVLKVYDHQPSHENLSPVQSLELCTPDGEVATVLGAVPLSEVVNTAKSDIPYILKVEISSGTTCWPGGSSLLIMALSFPEKQAWVTALESAVAALRASNPQGTKSSLHHYQGEVVTQLCGDKFLSLNCCLQTNKDLLLLGAEEGLFSLRLSDSKAVKSRPVKISGVTCVYQIAVLNELGIAVMIAGEARLLMKVDLRQLQIAVEAAECSRPSISARAVEVALDSCHLFAARATNPHDHSAPAVLCAASSDKIAIMKWNTESSEFVVCKMLETAEPCSCLHFAPHSVIVGCDKFFEVDLKDYSVEEFLDASDTSLAYAVIGTHQLNSFPVAVLDISNSPTSPEFLLCFHEFAVFVDPYGRRTREADVKWSHISFAFAFQKPYLFIFHFAMVEILKITHKSFTIANRSDPQSVIYPEQTLLEFPNPHLLGTSTLPGTIFLSTCSDIKVGNMLRLQGSLACPSIEDGSTTSLDTLAFQSEDCDGNSSDQVDASEFSFTSSIVESLDDLDENHHSKERENAVGSHHRVQFDKNINH